MSVVQIACVYGTRPEAIKMAPVVRAINGRDDADVVNIVTGQHREMLRQVLDLFEITPDIDLSVMKTNQDLFDVTGSVLLGLRGAFRHQRPDIVVVQGDTTSCFVGALAAFYESIPVAHVEAGLRTGDIRAPFPEEANRSLTTRLARWHFAPTDGSRDNLLREGVDPAAIEVTGNTVIDALLTVRSIAEAKSAAAYPELHAVRSVLESDAPVILVTGHRRENFGSGFESICRALATLADRYPDYRIIYPVHLNPNVQEPVRRILGNLSNVCLVEPVSYEPFVFLMTRSRIILTDSGGIQEEAPSLGKPVLVMREVTERPEAVVAGTVRLVGTDEARIVSETARLIEDAAAYDEMARAHNPYGDGHAADRIVERMVRDQT